MDVIGDNINILKYFEIKSDLSLTHTHTHTRARARAHARTRCNYSVKRNY